MIRAYKLQHDINTGKQKKIVSVLRAYRETSHKIANLQWRLFFTEAKFNKMLDLKSLESKLSERYKRNACYQVEATLKAFIGGIQHQFIRVVYHSKLDIETRKHLLQINRRKLWLSKLPSDLFAKSELSLAKSIFKHLLNVNKKPSFAHINMTLNANVAQIQMKQDDKASEFEYWIKLSTLEAGKPIMLPLKTNEYFDSIEGNILNSVQINQSLDGIEVCFIKDVPSQSIIFKSEKIAIDIGLKTLFALQDGNLFGNGFYAYLIKYDTLITELAKNRQRQGLKASSPHYNALVERLKAFIKNEICRCLNQIVELYSPKIIVIENLNFQNSDLSKTMNRLLSRFGKHFIEQKLASLHEKFGIEIQKINPAYTSQECHKCHYVDKRNRKSQKDFKCRFCGNECNADINAARNHFARSSVGDLANIYASKNTILQALVYRFLERCRRPYSWANDLLCGNPYFRGRPGFKDTPGKSRHHAQLKQEQDFVVLPMKIENTMEYHVT